VLNAGATIFVAGQADDLPAGVEKATDALASGAAKDVLEKLVERSRDLAAAAR
jgi:anthranilate phosphoribosyltransferase